MYGFKREPIFNIEKCNADNDEKNHQSIVFDKNERVLAINIKNNPVKLELPYTLALDMAQLEIESTSETHLFVNEKACKLTTSYFELNRVKKYAQEYAKTLSKEERDKLDMNSFTLEGMSKHGVINLLTSGMNPMIVEKLTGAKEQVLYYCQQEAMNLLSRGKNGS